MQKRRFALVLLSFVFLLTIFYPSSNSAAAAADVSAPQATLLTEVQPLGEIVSAVVLKYSTNIDGASLSTSSFQVQSVLNDVYTDRTVTGVYTNDTGAITNRSTHGKYVVIELDSQDKNASTLTYDSTSAVNRINPLNYYISQKKDIATSKKTVVPVSAQAIKATDKVTPIVDDFQKSTFENKDGFKLNYFTFEPKVEPGTTYPLVVFLHGNGERGDGNGVNLLANAGAVTWASPEQQAKHPSFVIAPQSPIDLEHKFIWADEPRNSAVADLVRETALKYPIDTNRIYIVGISQGAMGTWRLLEKNLDLFAAGVPIAGLTNYEKAVNMYAPVDPAHVEVLKNVPIWAFHAADDTTVSPKNSEEMVAAIKAQNGNLIHFTEYEAGMIKPTGHFSWVPALQDQDMIEWLFAQKK
ncbi:PHB depolymerase family esterase [Paenibacillus sp. CMAA1739]|uniref:PHB depolymerase family esterase n=1 Tax=Paenibacillus ottowii TaxID=2315729 RepID=UPI0027300E8D|nr:MULTISPECIES: PHB depolymerase family esterase [Paenibacillus]MDP1510351.1 PHB depolymerase family esterase [Paenibacillus ottowii]MEC4565768.1 PHB depolymerase family esterase [Paenibacillus sp. CMAA1739]